MALLRAQVRFRYFTGLPEDVSTNTFHFITDNSNPPDVDAATIASQLGAFYAGMGTAGPTGPFSPVIANTGHTIVVYNLIDPLPRVPVATITTPAPPRSSSAIGMPEECAAVLSFQADTVSGQNQSRRRGRVYIGPLSTATLDSGTGSKFATIGTTFANAVIDMAESNLLLGLPASIQWAVYSPTNSAAVPVTNGWFDLTWDTQRRRGGRSPVRTLWP